MKSIVSLLVVLFLFSTGIDAQNRGRNSKPDAPEAPEVPEFRKGPGPGIENIPGLTDEQREKLKEFRIQHQKQMQEMRNELAEMRAHLKVLTENFEKPDMTEINKTIDGITSRINETMKNQAVHMEELRKILNEEQFLRFRNGPGKGPLGPGRERGERCCDCPCRK